jgi:hypothetical protein
MGYGRVGKWENKGLPEFAWMAGTIFGLARATCAAKYMIRANWRLVGGLRNELPT